MPHATICCGRPLCVHALVVVHIVIIAAVVSVQVVTVVVGCYMHLYRCCSCGGQRQYLYVRKGYAVSTHILCGQRLSLYARKGYAFEIVFDLTPWMTSKTSSNDRLGVGRRQNCCSKSSQEKQGGERAEGKGAGKAKAKNSKAPAKKAR